VRELEITPVPGDPAIAAAIARALERVERPKRRHGNIPL
jgi:hypothetical protein